MKITVENDYFCIVHLGMQVKCSQNFHPYSEAYACFFATGEIQSSLEELLVQ